MKKNWLFSIAAIGMMLGVTGCGNRPKPVLELTPVKIQLPADPERLPMAWVYLLGKHVTGTPEITTTDSNGPYLLDFPAGFGVVGSGLRSVVCVSPDKASCRFFSRLNLDGADLPYWRECVSKVLVEYNGYKVVGEEFFESTEHLDGWRIVVEKTIGEDTYRYKFVVIPYDEELYMAECYGKASVFAAAEKAFDEAIDTADIAFWRITHDRESTDPFFYFDPVQVIPPEGKGAWAPSWTPLQLGLFPSCQLFSSKANVYGIGFNLFLLKQECVAGISLGLCNAVKTSYGIQLAPIFGATEKNDGISIGLLYNNVAENNGLSIGLFNRAEHGSAGVQIGLLNFNSDPDYFYCLPLINVPILALFR